MEFKKSRHGHNYNHIKDTLDGTEKKFGIEHHTVTATQLPSEFDLRSSKWGACCPTPLNQDRLGSCASNEVSNALRYCVGRELGAKAEWQPSRLYIYYFTRLLEGSPLNQDTGVTVQGAMESISKYGACSEDNWVYDITKFAMAPSSQAIRAAHQHTKGFKALSVPQDLTHIKQALFAGWPVVYGIQVYDSFESDQVAQTGTVPMPDTNNESCLGGHCVQICGYSDKTQRFTCYNSWGTSWGQKGFFTIPYQYVLDQNLASDFWICTYFK